ncbi:MAG: PEGA domain-containing protein [Polyangiaceae bacterium]
MSRLPVFLLILASACRPPLVAAKPKVSLRMAGTPADATVIIDDEVVGSLDLVAAHGVALPVGVHHVTVKASGYFPSDREVKAVEGQAPIRLEVALTPVPD